MKIGALLSVLSRKRADGELILVDTLSFDAPKAKAAKGVLANLAKGADASPLTTKKRNAALLALAAPNINAVKSFRNFGNVVTEEVRNLNPVDVLAHKYLVIENPEAAFKVLLGRTRLAARQVTT